MTDRGREEPRRFRSRQPTSHRRRSIGPAPSVAPHSRGYPGTGRHRCPRAMGALRLPRLAERTATRAARTATSKARVVSWWPREWIWEIGLALERAGRDAPDKQWMFPKLLKGVSKVVSLPRPRHRAKTAGAQSLFARLHAGMRPEPATLGLGFGRTQRPQGLEGSFTARPCGVGLRR